MLLQFRRLIKFSLKYIIAHFNKEIFPVNPHKLNHIYPSSSKTSMVRAEPSDHSWDVPHCPPGSKWVPGGNTGEVKGGEKRNWPPYLTMPAAHDKCPSNGHSPNVRNRTWDSSSTLYPSSQVPMIFIGWF